MGDKQVITVREDAQLKDVIKYASHSRLGVEPWLMVAVFVDSHSSISLLAQHRILSVPVLCKDSRDVLGFVDVMDILTFIVRLVTHGHDMQEAQWSAWANDIITLQAKGEQFGQTHVKRVMGTSPQPH